VKSRAGPTGDPARRTPHVRGRDVMPSISLLGQRDRFRKPAGRAYSQVSEFIYFL